MESEIISFEQNWTNGSNSTNFTEFCDSPWPTCYSVPVAAIIIVIGIALILVIISGNILVIVAVVKDTKLKKMRQNWLIVSLALADLLVGVLVMPLTLTYEVMGVWVMGLWLCELWLALDVLFVTASILNLCAISIDRLLCLTYPLQYPKQRTKVKMGLICSTAWALSFVICFPPLVGWRPQRHPGECFLSTDFGYVLYSALGSFYLPVFVLGFVYAKIFMIIKKRSQQRLKEATAKQAALIASQNTTLNAHSPRGTAQFLSAIAFSRKNSSAQSPSSCGSEETDPFLPKENGKKSLPSGMQENLGYTNQLYPSNINEESEEESSSVHMDITRPRRSISYNDGILSPIPSFASSSSVSINPRNSNSNHSFVSSESEFRTAFSSNFSLQSKDVFIDCTTERSQVTSPSLVTALEEFAIVSGDSYQLRRLSSRKHHGSFRDRPNKFTDSPKLKRPSYRSASRCSSALAKENGGIGHRICEIEPASDSPPIRTNVNYISTPPFIRKTTTIFEEGKTCIIRETPPQQRIVSRNGIVSLNNGKLITQSSPKKKLSFQVDKERSFRKPKSKNRKKDSLFGNVGSPIRNFRKKKHRAMSCPKVTFWQEEGSPRIPGQSHASRRLTETNETVQDDQGRFMNRIKALPSRISIHRSSRFSISFLIDDSKLQSRKSSSMSVTISERTPQEQIENRLRLLKAKDRKAAFSLGMILGSFIACWLPFFVLYVLTAVKVLAPEEVFDICFWLGYCNSALNPLIYACLNQDFRNAFRKVLGISRSQRRK